MKKRRPQRKAVEVINTSPASPSGDSKTGWPEAKKGAGAREGRGWKQTVATDLSIAMHPRVGPVSLMNYSNVLSCW